MSNLATIIVLTRDKGEGTITMDRDGEPVVDYVVSVYDRKHLLHGLLPVRRRCFRCRTSVPTWSVRRLGEFERQLERHGLGVNRLMMFTAH